MDTASANGADALDAGFEKLLHAVVADTSLAGRDGVVAEPEPAAPHEPGEAPRRGGVLPGARIGRGGDRPDAPAAAHDGAAVESPPLRVRIVVDTTRPAAWAAFVIERLARSRLTRLEALEIAGPPPPEQTSLYGLIDQRVNRPLHDAFEPRDVAGVAPVLPVTDGAAEGGADLPDVLVWLAPTPPADELSRRTRYGVLSCEVGAEGRPGDGRLDRPPGCPAVRVRVRMTTPGGDRLLAAASWIAADRSSAYRNRSRACWRAAALLARTVEALARDGFDDLLRRATHHLGPLDLHCVARERPLLSPLGSAAILARLLARRVYYGVRERLRLEQWVLLYSTRAATAASLHSFAALVPPPDRCFADPHLLHRDGVHHLFFEELPYATNKGYIVVSTLENGAWSHPKKALETDHHLSNPFVFEHDGVPYMIPESAARRAVELYRCERFPDRWVHAGTLLSDVRATDATLLCHAGRWWMFVAVHDHPGSSSHEELFVFHADDPVTGRWTPHRRNPVVSDVRRARPAGAPFVRGGVAFRPAQDCSVRYGHAVRFMRIDRLDEAEYVETEVAAIEPRWDPRVLGVHTFNQAGEVTVVDALRDRWRHW
jgi:hypothetical protein